MEENDDDVKDLEIKAIIGFDGSTINGLIVHPDSKHLVYPMGNKVVIQDFNTKKQDFLSGHTNIISAIAVSNSGKYIGSGQINHIGFRAQVIIWDFAQKILLNTHELHKVRVECVTFSIDDQYCITLGGRDCGSVFVWDIARGHALCGANVSRGIQGNATALIRMTKRGACFVTAGDNHLAVWTVDKEAKNVTSVDAAMPKLRRTILCIDANERDEFCFCGTSTGDMMKVRLNYHHDPNILQPVKQPRVVGCFSRITRKKLPRGSVDLYKQGIKSILRLFCGWLLIGAGDGTFEMVEETVQKCSEVPVGVKMPTTPALKVLKSTTMKSSITSIQRLNEDYFLVATVSCEIFRIHISDFNPELIVTCHTSPIYDVAFPHSFSKCFATASKDDVRLWDLQTMQEHLRIVVLNFSCSSVLFTFDGKAILTAWNDGIIRAFTPLTGRLMYSIFNAHNKGVSAMAITSHGRLLVSGGCEGQVRLWDITPYKQTLICTLKEHKGPVSAININSNDDEAVSASTDGTCILWDLVNKIRRQIIFANTLFMTVKYFPTDVQILTGGSDRKISYWEVLDGSLIREMEGCKTGSLNTLDISPCGVYFVTGGDDQIVKLWKYQEGITVYVGLGHSGSIKATRFSPDGKYVITCSASGSIFIWRNPGFGQTIEIPEEKKEVLDEAENVQDIESVRSKQSSIQNGGDCVCDKRSLSSRSSNSSCKDSCAKSSCKDSKCSSFTARRVKCKDSKCSSYREQNSSCNSPKIINVKAEICCKNED